MKPPSLFGVHCHQPISSGEDVIQNIIETSYKPLFKMLKKHPTFKCSVHFSGSLLEYIQTHDDDLFQLLQDLSSQLDFLVGGYYEPLLHAIPSNDRIGQIEKLIKFIKKHFNQSPHGLLCMDKSWDNAIIPDLKKCGITYVVLTTENTNISADKHGYYLTEEGGEVIGLFPVKTQHPDLLTLTHEPTSIFIECRLINKQWSNAFFENTSLSTSTFSEYFLNMPPIRLLYPHLESPSEWKNLLMDYQEINWLHKRCMELSNTQLPKKSYRQALYQAQTGDALLENTQQSHSDSKNLKDEAYKHLIACEVMHKKEGCEKIDIDLDGVSEYKFYTDELLSIVSPQCGGQLMELDILSCSFNLQNTFSRYAQLSSPNNESKSVHDWYLKKSNIDHISNEQFCLENFETCLFRELGDFANQPFDKIKHKKNSIILQRRGGIYHDANTKCPTSMEKKIRFQESSLHFETSLETEAEGTFLYINEWNLHFKDVNFLTFNDQPYNEHMQFFSNYLVIDDTVLNMRYSFLFQCEVEVYMFALKSSPSAQELCFGFCTPFSEALDFDFSFTVSSLTLSE